MIEWHWRRLDELTPQQLYAVIAAREAVFIVEQNCVYQDLDGLDFRAHHLIAWSDDSVAAYLRVIEPGAKYKEPSIGRVLTMPPFRNKGLGRELVNVSFGHIARTYPGQGIRISAQSYLERFYRSLGFAPCSAHYSEDNIPHVEMLRP